MSPDRDIDHEQPPAKRARVEDAADVAADPSSSSTSIDPKSLAYRLAQFGTGASAEELVGISTYINPGLPAFESAIIKHRFTDFLVWEISKAGEVVRLQDIGRPATKETAPSVENGKAPEANLADHLDEAKLQELESFVAAGESKDAVMRTDSISSKDQRKAFHAAIRSVYEGKLSTEAEGDGIIRISWSLGKSRDQRNPRPSKQDQRDLPPYIQFTLQKTNRETQDCISHLSNRLSVHVKDLGTAGTKDKRGVTTQLVSLKRGRRTIEEIWDHINGLHHGKFRGGPRNDRQAQNGEGFLGRDALMPAQRGERGLRIGDLSYIDKPLELGQLSGNRFSIVLREVKVPSEDVMAASLATLQNTGFINYYGMQRFGNSSVPTHAIGLALLQSNWKEAARLILCEKNGDSDETRLARQAWNVDRDTRKALRLLPRWAVAERCMLEFYDKNGGDSNQQAAISKIPKNLRMMYVHAYQSYIWNAAVSERIKQHGCDKPVPGDLVSASEVQEEKAPQTGKITKESVITSAKVAKVKVLDTDDVQNYAIQDVVLPLPGFGIVYPQGELGNVYKGMMHADGLDPDDMFRKQKEYSLGGAYRRILTKPSDLTWEILHYSDPDEPLLQADEDKLLGMEFKPTTGDKMALKVDFGLDTASYATMALREILKMETGNVQQKEMSDKAREAEANEQ